MILDCIAIPFLYVLQTNLAFQHNVYLLGLLLASRQWAAALQPKVVRDNPLQQLHFFPDHKPG